MNKQINETIDSFEASVDFCYAIPLLAKHNKSFVEANDVLGLLKDFHLQNSFDEKKYKKYIMNANYTNIKYQEEILINAFFDCLEKGLNTDLDYEKFIHSKKWLVQGCELEFAYYFDMLYYYYGKNHNSYESTIRYIFRNNKDFSFCGKHKVLNDVLNSICNDYYDDLLCDYFLDNNLIDTFEMMEVYTIRDLLNLNKDICYILLSRNIDHYIEFFETLKKRKKDNISNLIILIQEMQLKSFKKPIRKEIFYKRYGINCKRCTLEELGIEYGVTRERIRQIAKKVTDYLKEKYSKLFNTILFDTIEKQGIKSEYLDFDDVKTFIENDEISYLLKAYIEILCEKIVFDEKYNVFHYKDKFEELILSRLNILPLYILKDDVKEYSGIDYKIITKSRHYRCVKDKGYIKSDYYLKDLYCMIIDELYPNGFERNENFTKTINQLMADRFDIDAIDERNLFAIIDRCNYCFIGRGKMINRSFVVPLSEELSNKILNYISEYDADAIFYSTIYAVFKEELYNAGIDNKYYLKGLLDINLPEGYIPQKDYISIGQSFKTASDAINNVISSFNGVFEIEKLRKKFPGVADFTFLNILASRDDVIRYDYGNVFYRFNSLALNTELDSVIKEEINDLFNQFNFPFTTSSKIYSRMRIRHMDLLKRVSFLDTHFAFFSYIEKKIKDFHYQRPFISREETSYLSAITIISNYADSLDYFNNRIIASFCSNMHLNMRITYLELIVDKADNFVQVDVTNCVKKEKIRIDDKKLESIKYEIDYYINSFGSIDTRSNISFDGYPYMGYSWNKYLLVGIIRGYFNNDYIVENTDGNYAKTDYIIRRI